MLNNIQYKTLLNFFLLNEVLTGQQCLLKKDIDGEADNSAAPAATKGTI
jgi:hypothetical protein